MLDHISLGVSDFARSMAFYDAVLASLGFGRVWTAVDAAGYGYADEDEPFAIKHDPAVVAASSRRSHVAFTAATPDAAVRFHAAGMSLGGADEGAPEFCPEYGDGYFAAFLRDPEAHRLEAVYHDRGARNRMH